MSVDAEKAFDKIQHALMIKAFHKVFVRTKGHVAKGIKHAEECVECS